MGHPSKILFAVCAVGLFGLQLMAYGLQLIALLNWASVTRSVDFPCLWWCHSTRCRKAHILRNQQSVYIHQETSPYFFITLEMKGWDRQCWIQDFHLYHIPSKLTSLNCNGSTNHNRCLCEIISKSKFYTSFVRLVRIKYVPVLILY